MEPIIIQAIMNNMIVYEKVINHIPKDTSFLYSAFIDTNQDYYRCLYKERVFNVPIHKMPSTIITQKEVPPIVLEIQLVQKALEKINKSNIH